MSKALSASATFEAVKATADAAMPQTGGAFTGAVTFVDANFSISIPSVNPRITFDSTDYLRYDRTANNLSLMLGGSTAVLMSAQSLWVADTQFGLFYNGGSTVFVGFDTGDTLRYDRTSNAFQFVIGSVAIATIFSNKINFALGAVPIYADNTAATSGGLNTGDVYRTPTGQLMVRY